MTMTTDDNDDDRWRWWQMITTDDDDGDRWRQMTMMVTDDDDGDNDGESNSDATVAAVNTFQVLGVG